MFSKKWSYKHHIDDHAEHEVDAEGSWAISYGDMVTLLLTFFILFFSINPSEKKIQLQALQISLVDTLRDHSAFQSNESANGDPTMNLANQKKDEKGMDKEILKVWNGVAHDMGNHVIIEFPGISFFKSGDTALTHQGEKALADFLKVYTPYMAHYKVSIRAFTDTRQVRSIKGRKYQDNLELSALRSIAGLRHLQKAGLPLNKMKIGGYGELSVTVKELEKISVEKREPASEGIMMSLARKIVLVIEPEDT